MKNLFLSLALFLVKSSFALGPGIHIFKVQFGSGPVFNDIVVVDEFGDGSFTVPGVFTYPIEVSTTLTKPSESSFDFVLKGKEANRPFNFLFTGKVSKEAFKGTIMDQETKKLIGSFSGEKIHDL